MLRAKYLFVHQLRLLNEGPLEKTALLRVYDWILCRFKISPKRDLADHMLGGGPQWGLTESGLRSQKKDFKVAFWWKPTKLLTMQLLSLNQLFWICLNFALFNQGTLMQCTAVHFQGCVSVVWFRLCASRRLAWNYALCQNTAFICIQLDLCAKSKRTDPHFKT